MIGDSADPRFRTFQHGIKEAIGSYKAALQELLPAREPVAAKLSDAQPVNGQAH